jgi:preprotein translocase, YajC subunit
MTYFNSAFVLFAEATNSQPPDNRMFFVVIIGVLAFMYFVMVLPQKRERNRWNAMVESLKKNDRVLMSCGIIGKVHAVHKEKNEIVIKVDDDSNTKMTFSLAAIARVLDDSSSKEKKD